MPDSAQFRLAVIGGSGLYRMDCLQDVESLAVDTPYGPTDDPVIRGTIDGVEVLFLARHGSGHNRAPHEVNYRANVCALKQLGATHLLAISAVGSMKEELAPGDVVVVDQFINLAQRRVSTFFDGGIVAHVGFADPVCPELARAAFEAARRAGARVHEGGTYVCIDGPQFSTRSESRLYRSWDVSVIGMTAMPEAKLAREAELPYALLGFVTDYDCWHETEEDVSVETVLAVLRSNARLAQSCVEQLAPHLPDPTRSPAHGALQYAVITPPDHISATARARLDWLLPGLAAREEARSSEAGPKS